MTSLTSGPPGAVSTHTPDVCYPASGYRTVREPARETIDLPEGRNGELLRRRVREEDRHPDRAATGPVGVVCRTAPGAPRISPRFAYLRAPELYKLYVVTPVAESDAGRPAEDPPEVRKFVAATFAQYSGLFAGR